MTQLLARADALADRLLDEGDTVRALGKRLKAMTADGYIDDAELRQLEAMAERLLEQGAQIEEDGLEACEIASDVLTARQVLAIGRQATPNRHLVDRERDLERMRMQRGLRGRGRPEQRKSLTAGTSSAGGGKAKAA